MKKIIATTILAMSGLAQAATQVPVIWPFAAGSNQANAMRVVMANANKAQSKYEFYFENKPGAGGAIATNAVINAKEPVLMMHSTSVFTRPYYYPDQSFDVSKLQPLAIAGMNSPMVLLSAKYGTVDELRAQKNVNIGANYGSVTEYITRQVGASIAPANWKLVPYPGTLQSTTDVIAGNLDTGVEFIKDSLQWVQAGKVKIIGLTGEKEVAGYKTLKSQGVTGVENAIGNFYFLAGPNVPAEQVKEFHKILSEASNKDDVRKVWADDYAQVPNFTYEETVKYWNKQRETWKK